VADGEEDGEPEHAATTNAMATMRRNDRRFTK
jgi:hypothetical protein